MPNDASLLLLDKSAVAALLTPGDVQIAVREAFILHSDGRARVFPVIREHLKTGGVFGIKSGDIEDSGVLGFKAAGFWPGNKELGGEPHQATILLFDPANGRPLCVIDGNAVTTMRTGAAGALGLARLANPSSSQLCVFGTGVQARIQTHFALKTLPLLRVVRYVSFDDQRVPAFEAEFSDRCDISLAVDRNGVVAESDVIVTATPGGGALFDEGAVQPGTHLNCIGADTKGKRELPAGLLHRARVFVDDRLQARQIGEGQWAPEIATTELGDLLTGRADFVRQPTDITIFDMTGIALQDLTVARLLQQRAEATNAGTRVNWPW